MDLTIVQLLLQFALSLWANFCMVKCNTRFRYPFISCPIVQPINNIFTRNCRSALDSSEWCIVLQDSATLGHALVICTSLALFESQSLCLMSSRICSGQGSQCNNEGDILCNASLQYTKICIVGPKASSPEADAMGFIYAHRLRCTAEFILWQYSLVECFWFGNFWRDNDLTEFARKYILFYNKLIVFWFVVESILCIGSLHLH